jgi:nucleoside-diphosphate-sugar epimerase
VRDFSQDTLHAALARSNATSMYHLAATGVRPTDRDLDTMVEANTLLPVRIVKVAAKLGATMIHVGSFSEYGSPIAERARVTETAPLETEKLYGSTKAAGGLLASAAAHASGVTLRVLRLFKVYGPGEESHRLLPSLVNGLVARRRVALSDGTQIRDFLHVDDAVDAMITACRHARGSDAKPVEFFNVCSGRGHSVREFAEATARALGAPVSLLGFGDLSMRPDDAPEQVGDPTRMASITGWRATRDLGAGILDSVRRLQRWPLNPPFDVLSACAGKRAG